MPSNDFDPFFYIPEDKMNYPGLDYSGPRVGFRTNADKSPRPILPFELNKPWMDIPEVFLLFPTEKLSTAKSALLSLDDSESHHQLFNTHLLLLEKGLLDEKFPLGQQLRNIVEDYHKIDKSDLKKLNVRMRFLKDIQILSEQFLHQESASLTEEQKKTLQELIENTILKRNYLEKVLKLPKKINERVFQQLKSRGLYFSQGSGFFSDVDPAHREAPPELYDWYQQVQENRMLNFWVWAESLPRHVSSQFEVNNRYAPKPERMVLFINGLCFSSQNKSIPLEGEFLYAIDKKNRLLILSEQGNTHNVITGSKVKTAGHIKFTNGKITLINNASGHYAPPARGLIEGAKNLIPFDVFTKEAEIEFFYGEKVSINDIVKNNYQLDEIERKSIEKLDAMGENLRRDMKYLNKPYTVGIEESLEGKEKERFSDWRKKPWKPKS